MLVCVCMSAMYVCVGALEQHNVGVCTCLARHFWYKKAFYFKQGVICASTLLLHEFRSPSIHFIFVFLCY